MRKREREKQEAWESLIEPLKACGPDGTATLEILALEHKSSSSGITTHIELRVWENVDGRPRPTYWLTRNVAKGLGYTFNAKRETLTMGGFGYCRAEQLAKQLSGRCGHPLRVESVNFFAGPCGWYPHEPHVAKKTA